MSLLPAKTLDRKQVHVDSVWAGNLFTGKVVMERCNSLNESQIWQPAGKEAKIGGLGYTLCITVLLKETVSF